MFGRKKPEIKPIHEAVELILKRMDSNPDEFVAGNYKWAWLFQELEASRHKHSRTAVAGLPFLREDELELMTEKLKVVGSNNFIKRVMGTILEEDNKAQAIDANPFHQYAGQTIGMVAASGSGISYNK